MNCNLIGKSFTLILFLIFFSGPFISLHAQTSCNCTEYIYLNEPDIGSVLKFEVGSDLLLTELIGANGGTSPNQHWYPGLNNSQLANPHGVATDLNGNIYIGDNSGAGNPIRKFDCDGTISPIDGTTITTTNNL